MNTSFADIVRNADDRIMKSRVAHTAPVRAFSLFQNKTWVLVGGFALLASGCMTGGSHFEPVAYDSDAYFQTLEEANGETAHKGSAPRGGSAGNASGYVNDPFADLTTEWSGPPASEDPNTGPSRPAASPEKKILGGSSPTPAIQGNATGEGDTHAARGKKKTPRTGGETTSARSAADQALAQIIGGSVKPRTPREDHTKLALDTQAADPEVELSIDRKLYRTDLAGVVEESRTNSDLAPTTTKAINRPQVAPLIPQARLRVAQVSFTQKPGPSPKSRPVSGPLTAQAGEPASKPQQTAGTEAHAKATLEDLVTVGKGSNEAAPTMEESELLAMIAPDKAETPEETNSKTNGFGQGVLLAQADTGKTASDVVTTTNTSQDDKNAEGANRKDRERASKQTDERYEDGADSQVQDQALLAQATSQQESAGGPTQAPLASESNSKSDEVLGSILNAPQNAGSEPAATSNEDAMVAAKPADDAGLSENRNEADWPDRSAGMASASSHDKDSGASKKAGHKVARNRQAPNVPGDDQDLSEEKEAKTTERPDKPRQGASEETTQRLAKNNEDPTKVMDEPTQAGESETVEALEGMLTAEAPTRTSETQAPETQTAQARATEPTSNSTRTATHTQVASVHSRAHVNESPAVPAETEDVPSTTREKTQSTSQARKTTKATRTASTGSRVEDGSPAPSDKAVTTASKTPDTRSGESQTSAQSQPAPEENKTADAKSPEKAEKAGAAIASTKTAATPEPQGVPSEESESTTILSKDSFASDGSRLATKEELHNSLVAGGKASASSRDKTQNAEASGKPGQHPGKRLAQGSDGTQPHGSSPNGQAGQADATGKALAGILAAAEQGHGKGAAEDQGMGIARANTSYAHDSGRRMARAVVSADVGLKKATRAKTVDPTSSFRRVEVSQTAQASNEDVRPGSQKPRLARASTQTGNTARFSQQQMANDAGGKTIHQVAVNRTPATGFTQTSKAPTASTQTSKAAATGDRRIRLVRRNTAEAARMDAPHPAPTTASSRERMATIAIFREQEDLLRLTAVVPGFRSREDLELPRGHRSSRRRNDAVPGEGPAVAWNKPTREWHFKEGRPPFVT